MDILLTNIQSPVILFFLLGVFAGLVKSDLEIPSMMAKGVALYMIAAIGLKGGLAISEKSIDSALILLILSGVILGFVLPFIGNFFLRRTSDLGPIDTAAIAGHYGSVSLVTFIAASEFLRAQTGNPASGEFIALLAFMESPAILAALVMAAPHIGKRARARRKSEIAREVFLNGTMVLLLGSMLIGYITPESEISSIKSVFVEPFKGVLCFFLLDMGINIGRRFKDLTSLQKPVFAFAFYMPLISSVIALGVSALLGLDPKDAFLFLVLSSSASYIAVPAALKIALPEANPALYTSLPLALTFPFNIALGIPLYYWMAGLLG
ncbi:MAG: sodium-dependent bicarbonate transport family permease [Alphaproteobacteria bacterium]